MIDIKTLNVIYTHGMLYFYSQNDDTDIRGFLSQEDTRKLIEFLNDDNRNSLLITIPPSCSCRSGYITYFMKNNENQDLDMVIATDNQINSTYTIVDINELDPFIGFYEELMDLRDDIKNVFTYDFNINHRNSHYIISREKGKIIFNYQREIVKELDHDEFQTVLDAVGEINSFLLQDIDTIVLKIPSNTIDLIFVPSNCNSKSVILFNKLKNYNPMKVFILYACDYNFYYFKINSDKVKELKNIK